MMEEFYVSGEETYTKKTDDSSYSLFEWRVNQSCMDLLHAELIIHVKHRLNHHIREQVRQFYHSDGGDH